MDFDSISRSIYMVLGIGLVIFVHELGHFIAARLCKVRVETFSLGFGPKLFGWRRGDTLYQLALLPIGGFCRMAGEDPAEHDGAPRPYELRAKSVGQRFLIYSGGVVMNMAFGIVVLPLVLFYGVPFDDTVIGVVVPGGPAWQAGVEPGMRVLAVNDKPVIGFEYIAHEVALGNPERTRMLLQIPGESAPRIIEMVPTENEEIGIYIVGVGPGVDYSKPLQVAAGSAAASAGLRDDDVLVDVESALPELSLDARLSMAVASGAPLRLRVRGPDAVERSLTITPKLREHPEEPRLGVLQALNVVAATRANPDLTALDLRGGDRIVRVNGRRVLRQRDLELALVADSETLAVTVVRAGAQVELHGAALDRKRALKLASDVALGPDKSRIELVLGTNAVVAGLVQDGDVLLSANGVDVKNWREDFMRITSEAGREQRSVQLRIARERADGSVEQLELSATPAPFMEAAYGLAPREALYTYRAKSVGEAIQVGVQGTWKFATDTWLTIKRMLLGQVSSKNMGGIISIGVASYTFAEMGLAKLIFFLCMLSVNLAFINVLPVPLLDGGHLFFLIIEKVKGSPVSERVFGYSQIVGLVLILTLVIYVTFNDVNRWLL